MSISFPTRGCRIWTQILFQHLFQQIVGCRRAVDTSFLKENQQVDIQSWRLNIKSYQRRVLWQITTLVFVYLSSPPKNRLSQHFLKHTFRKFQPHFQFFYFLAIFFWVCLIGIQFIVQFRIVWFCCDFQFHSSLLHRTKLETRPQFVLQAFLENHGYLDTAADRENQVVLDRSQ